MSKTDANEAHSGPQPAAVMAESLDDSGGLDPAGGLNLAADLAAALGIPTEMVAAAAASREFRRLAHSALDAKLMQIRAVLAGGAK